MSSAGWLGLFALTHELAAKLVERGLTFGTAAAAYDLRAERGVQDAGDGVGYACDGIA